PMLFVKFVTNWYWLSSCFSGQLQRPVRSPRAVPKLMLIGVLPLPTLLMKPPGRPVVKGSPGTFIPGIPASSAGVFPKSLGNTSTWYLNQPKRTSQIDVDESVRSMPTAMLWFFTFVLPPRSTTPGPPPAPNAEGPVLANFA